jgi:DNA-binding XRE family transcriptional regulator
MARIPKHGHCVNGKSSPTHKSWCMMKSRCNNPNYNRYKDYGGRGIAYCKEWESFENFLRDMGERPKGTTLDRIDNNGNYELSNCKWSTPKEQMSNKRFGRTKRMILDKAKALEIIQLYRDSNLTQAEIALMYGCSRQTVNQTINGHRWK